MIHQHRAILQSIAHRAMLERGSLPDFSAAVLAELDRMQAPADVHGGPALFLALFPPRLQPWLDWRRICACRTGLRRA